MHLETVANLRARRPLDLPQVDLFLNLDLFISLERSERVISVRRSREGERERRKSREVDLFRLQGCESKRKFLARKTQNGAKTQNDFHQNVNEYCSFHVTQMKFFVYSAVCSQQY